MVYTLVVIICTLIPCELVRQYVMSEPTPTASKSTSSSGFSYVLWGKRSSSGLRIPQTTPSRPKKPHYLAGSYQAELEYAEKVNALKKPWEKRYPIHLWTPDRNRPRY